MRIKTPTAIILAAAALLISSGMGFADRGQPNSGGYHASPGSGRHYAPPRGGSYYGGGRQYDHPPRSYHHHGPAYSPRHYGWPAYHRYHDYRYGDHGWGSRYYFGGSFYEPGFGFFFGSGGWW